MNSKRVLFVPFIKYTSSKFYSHCIQNCKFLKTKNNFLETKICFVEKMFNIIFGLCIYFVQKSVKMILENHSLKPFWTAYYIPCHLVYIHNIPSHFYDLILV